MTQPPGRLQPGVSIPAALAAVIGGTALLGGASDLVLAQEALRQDGGR